MAMQFYQYFILLLVFTGGSILLITLLIVPPESHISFGHNPISMLYNQNHVTHVEWPRKKSLGAGGAVTSDKGIEVQTSSSDISAQSSLKPIINSENKAKKKPVESVKVCHREYPTTCKMYNYVRYWKHLFTAEDCYESPLRPKLRHQTPIEQQKYLIFQPDLGGWNNERLAFETVVLIAHASGRTLVLPYDLKPYSAMLNSRMDIKLEDIYDFDKLNDTMTIISMSTFLTQVASREGVLKERFNYTGDLAEYVRYPSEDLWQYMYRACYSEQWKVERKMLGFNIVETKNSTDNAYIINLNYTQTPLLQYVLKDRYIRPYDEQLNNERALFFPADLEDNYRVLGNFYYYLYWEDRKLRKFYMRFVRDRLHYKELLFCAASQIVRMIHEEVKQLYHKSIQRDVDYSGGNVFLPNHATYHAMHIRRQDFYYLYKTYNMSIAEVWASASKVINLNVTKLIYISTDELNIDEFKVITQSDPTIQIRFLKGYLKHLPHFFEENESNGYTTKDHLQAVRMYHLGMIEQIICANAHTFIGTFLSTFSSYITRMRGYYHDSRYGNTYYADKNGIQDLFLRKSRWFSRWEREYDIAFKNIDI